jgi:hypothetical protein
VNVKVAYRNAYIEGSATSLDLSMGGLFLQMTKLLPAQEVLEFSFQVNVEGKRPDVRCLGRVARVLSVEQAQTYGLLPGVAVEFRKFYQGQGALRAFLAERLGVMPEEVGEPAAPGTRPQAPASGVPEPGAASPNRPASGAHLEPPLKAASIRSGPRGQAQPPEPLAPEWTREEWQGYFEAMRRGARAQREEPAAPAPAAWPPWRSLVRLALLTAGVTVAFFLVLGLMLRLL